MRMPHGDRGLTDSPHQSYAENKAVKYNFYRFSCGRDSRLDSVWGDTLAPVTPGGASAQFWWS